MPMNKAVTLILKAIGPEDTRDKAIQKAAKRVVSTLGHLALPIVQAGAMVGQGYCKMDESCEVFPRRRKERLESKIVGGDEDFKYTAYAMWELSRNMINEGANEAGRDTLELFNVFSFLHHNGIPEDVFHRAWE